MDDPNLTPYSFDGMLKTIALHTSVEIAVSFARAFGNRKLSIPRNITREHPVTKLFGLKTARLIAYHLGGERYTVPSAVHLLRWHDARKMRRAGRTPSKIAAELKLSVRHVEKLTAGVQPERLNGEVSAVVVADCPVCGHRTKKHRCSPVDERQLSLL